MQEVRQPCDVHSNPPRLVLREHLRLQSFSRIVPRIQIGERLAVGVSDDVAARNGFGSPGWWEAAGRIRGEEGEAAGRRMASSSLA